MKNKIIKNLIKIIGFFAVLVLQIYLILYLCTYCIEDPYERSYQRALVRQYDYYNSIHENKIVFVGNSSLVFGMDVDLMEEKTGKRCALLANHGGMGMQYMLNMSKSNLNKGDVVVIEFRSNDIEDIGTDLLISGIGNRLDMYKHININHIDNIAKDYNKSIVKKIAYSRNNDFTASGAYSIDSFDSRGYMMLQRDECTLPYPYTDEVAKKYLWTTFEDDFDIKYIKFLNSYVDYCYDRGVKVYFTTIVYFDEALASTKQEIINYDKQLAKLLKAPFISKTLDYCFSREYIFNATQHCNSIGAVKRTELLYKDLSEYI